MKSITKTFFAFTMILILARPAAADTFEARVDKFYDGLAGVIESNLDSGEKCKAAVDSYYAKNQSLVREVRSRIESSMAAASSMMDDPAAVQSEMPMAMEAMPFQEGMRDSNLTPGSRKYASSMKKLMMKDPRVAMYVASKTTEFMPED